MKKNRQMNYIIYSLKNMNEQKSKKIGSFITSFQISPF